MTLCYDASYGLYIPCRVSVAQMTLPLSKSGAAHQDVRGTLFGAGMRVQSTTELRCEPLAKISAPEVVDDPRCALAIALADALFDDADELAYSPFDIVLALGCLRSGDNHALEFHLDDHAARSLAGITAQLTNRFPDSRILVVAPRAALGVFRQICRDRSTHRLVLTPNDLDPGAQTPEPHVTCLALRESTLHFQALCYRLREFTSRSNPTPRVHLQPLFEDAFAQTLDMPRPSLPVDTIDPLASTVEVPAPHETQPLDAVSSSEREGAQLVDQRYRLGAALGAGGWGRVARAFDTQLQRDVALKIIHPRLLDSSGVAEFVLKRFRREVALSASFKHPHLVAVYDTGIIEHKSIDPITGQEHALDLPYLVMELLDGHDLSYAMGERSLTPRVVHTLGLQTLDALAYVHKNGVVHKDLKPSNLFWTLDHAGDPHAYVMDFGVSYSPKDRGGRMTATGTFTGTPEYVAPEYVLEERAAPTPALDVYQMGLTLAELFTGEPLLPHGLTINQVIGRFIRREAVCLPDVFSNTALGDVLERAISFEPEDRYVDATEFYLAWRELDPAEFPDFSPAAVGAQIGTVSDIIFASPPQPSSPGGDGITTAQGVSPDARERGFARSRIPRAPPSLNRPPRHHELNASPASSWKVFFTNSWLVGATVGAALTLAVVIAWSFVPEKPALVQVDGDESADSTESTE